MVAFTQIFALTGLFISMAVATPIAEPDDAVVEFKGEYITELDVRDNEKRQSEVRCLAKIGLGPPGSIGRCGSINYRPNSATGFNPQDPRFPNCNIVTEIAFPNCNEYRVVSITNCGGERAVDIRAPSRGC